MLKNLISGFLCAAVILSASVSAFAETRQFEAFVVGVSDGDTIKVKNDNAIVTVRLNGIDCPEKKQAFGQRAKQFTATLSMGKTVTVISTGKDRYGRTLGDVRLPDGTSLNEELVKSGNAWWYRKFAPHNTHLQAYESEARMAKKGLWRDDRALAPWEFRKVSKGQNLTSPASAIQAAALEE